MGDKEASRAQITGIMRAKVSVKADEGDINFCTIRVHNKIETIQIELTANTLHILITMSPYTTSFDQ